MLRLYLLLFKPTELKVPKIAMIFEYCTLLITSYLLVLQSIDFVEHWKTSNAISIVLMILSLLAVFLMLSELLIVNFHLRKYILSESDCIGVERMKDQDRVTLYDRSNRKDTMIDPVDLEFGQSDQDLHLTTSIRYLSTRDSYSLDRLLSILDLGDQFIRCRIKSSYLDQDQATVVVDKYSMKTSVDKTSDQYHLDLLKFKISKIEFVPCKTRFSWFGVEYDREDYVLSILFEHVIPENYDRVSVLRKLDRTIKSAQSS